MKTKPKLIAGGLLALLAGLITLLYSHRHSVAVLNPSGSIADQERDLFVFTASLSLIVVIPVFVMLFWFVWKYREGNDKKATYTPDWDGSRILETIWWTVPGILILILSVITWQSSHKLDPFRPIASSKKTMTIQVVALDWKWLFIYPEQHIATVNYVQFPEKTPVKFEITADAPMNSFWIPKLGGQIYAMSGMSTHLNLMADGVGNYRGSSANISGRGFAGMKFVAKSTTQADFRQWVNQTKQAPATLSTNEYNKLVKPSENNKPSFYSSSDPALYGDLVAKYSPHGQHLGHSE